MIEDFRARGIPVIPVDVTRALGDPADVPYPDAVSPSVLTGINRVMSSSITTRQSLPVRSRC